MPRNIFCLLLIVLFAFVSPSAKAQTLDLSVFEKLPIMHQGRIKPIGSFARSELKKLSGQEENAAAWLAETLFNPARAESINVLKVSHPDIINLLELEKRSKKLYSYQEISSALSRKQDILISALKTPEEEWTRAQKELVLLQQNTVLLADLLASMGLFLPLSVDIPQSAPASLQEYAGKPLTYLEISKFREKLQNEMKRIIQANGENIEKYSPEERNITFVYFTYTNLQNVGERSNILKIVPANSNNAWNSPWKTLLEGKGTPETKLLFDELSAVARAYHNNDSENWQKHIESIGEHIKRLAKDALSPTALETEYYYNLIEPFKISLWFYIAALLIILACIKANKPWENMAAYTLAGGLIAHMSGIVARMYILERPPVSTLYESVIFVGAVSVLYCLFSYSKNKEDFWLIMGAFIGIFLQILGFSHNQDGDSFLMLTAVLNTNFWLATHVICITMGYAFCLVTSILAHIYLFQDRKGLFKQLHTIALLALLFSAVGTVLGGIWADQSWGRFWGWDPKENGALLIVLWLIWILHGRISGQMKETWVTAGLAYLSVIVALSWFGVNLLSVGLHAYGFTDGMAWSLAGFVILETALITVLSFRKKNRLHAH